MNARDAAESVQTFVDRAASRWGSGALRWIAVLLWLGNVSWKRPPNFGRTDSGCRSLCKYIEHGIDHPVLPGSAWLFEHVLSPNLTAFGWITILGEGAVAALLASGRFRRTAAFGGIAFSIGILAAVANAPGEWYWSYLLMIAIHIAVIVTTPNEPEPPARAMAAVTAAFGVALMLAHIGEGVTGTEFTFFADGGKFPRDLVQNLFGGSVAFGVLMIAIGAGAWAIQQRYAPKVATAVGGGLIGLAVLMFLTYGPDGTFLGLGATTTAASVIGALGLALAVGPTLQAEDETGTQA